MKKYPYERFIIPCAASLHEIWLSFLLPGSPRRVDEGEEEEEEEERVEEEAVDEFDDEEERKPPDEASVEELYEDADEFKLDEDEDSKCELKQHEGPAQQTKVMPGFVLFSITACRLKTTPPRLMSVTI